MANIESKLTTIKSAAGGEDVREAIIGALRDINNDVPADMSNPVQIKEDMPLNSDLIKPLNPPQLVSQIYIKQAGSGGKSTKLVEATITENGTYPTSDKDDGGGSYDPDKENRYYSKVTVKVPQLANAVLDLEEEITQNGTYSAPADWGVDGLRTFTVNVNAATGDGPFQVEFYDKPQSDPTAAVIETQLVSYGGSAQNVKTPPTSDIGVFTGWNPAPLNVTRDMKCYPVFGQVIIDPTEILDDWTVICQRRGVGYPIGAKKSVAYGATFTQDEIKTFNPSYSSGDVIMNFSMMLHKVGEGEGGTHSTWLSSKINFSAATYANMFGYLSDQNWSESSGLRLFLNSIFFSHMSSTFKNVITPVTKYSCNRGTLIPTQDTIWIPGTSEIGTDNTSPSGESPYDFQNSNDYLYNLDKLDAVSVKYIRTYFDNNRDYVISTVLSNEQGQWGNTDSMMLRDNDPTYGQPQWFNHNNYEPYLLIYGRGGNNQRCINIGFCM